MGIEDQSLNKFVPYHVPIERIYLPVFYVNVIYICIYPSSLAAFRPTYQQYIPLGFLSRFNEVNTENDCRVFRTLNSVLGSSVSLYETYAPQSQPWIKKCEPKPQR